MSEHAVRPVADLEMGPSWEGRAEHAPGVLFEASQCDGNLAGDVALRDLAGWVALAALSGATGNAASEAIKAKVRDVLTAWRRRNGQGKLDELKQHVSEEMQKHHRNGKLTQDELEKRIAAFFGEIQG